MKVVAWCSQSNDTETKNAITLSSLNGIVVCYICKSVLKYDWRTPGSSHIKRHVKIVSHVKANTSNNCLLLILIKNTKAKSVFFNLFVIAEPLKHFYVCHGTAINKKLNKHELHVKKANVLLLDTSTNKQLLQKLKSKKFNDSVILKILLQSL